MTMAAGAGNKNLLIQHSSFHNPVLKLQEPNKTQKVHDILNEFVIDRVNIEKLRTIFRSELEDGLLGRKDRTPMSMMNTFVPALQTVDSKKLVGDYISLDIGSTNFRVLHTCLSETDNCSTVSYYDIPEQYRKNDSSKLFEFLASSIEHFVEKLELKYHQKGHILPLGFTFSFPFEQQAINIGVLQTWTKNFDLPDVVGKDVVARLQQQIDQRGNPFNIQVVAILNDSTGTLINGSHLDSDCAIGVIMGSGHNACYLEKIDKIVKWGKWRSAYDSVDEMLINMECGCFGDNGSIDFITNRFDRLVDQSSLFPGSFKFEKYLSGHFLGELLRYTLVECVQNSVLLEGKQSDLLKTSNSIKSKDLSAIEEDESNECCKELLRRLGYSQFDSDDIDIVRFACQRISVRIATILSATISVLIERVNKPRTVVAIDGSLYKNHPNMHRLMTDFIEQLVPTGKQFHLILAEDGSGKGAGIVAALASKLSLSADSNFT